MPELRQNLATKEWVIIATERAKRPDQFIEQTKGALLENYPTLDPTCPFCCGNEELDLEVERWPLTGPWQTRVVQNKYPALDNEGELSRTFDGVNRWISGVGRHELVIEHPHHNTTWPLMTPEEIEHGLQSFHRRGWEMLEDPRIEQIIFFKNHGKRAGASLIHPHSQIISLPIVPHHIRRRNDEARQYFDDQGQNVFQVMLDDELKQKERLLTVSDHFVAFIPYAAPGPFHIWIIPRQQSVSFLYTQPDEMTDLAYLLHDVLRRLYFGLRDPNYNLVIRSSPVKELGNSYLQWFVTIAPRLSHTAGFELGSGMFINTALPEESAAFLREVKV